MGCQMKIDRYCLDNVVNKGEISQQSSIIHELPEIYILQSQNPDEDRLEAVDGVTEVEVEDHQQQ